MCGVFGCIGADNALDKTLEGLHLLQYRGEEGAGVALWNPPTGLIYDGLKRIGTVDHLRQKINESRTKFSGMACIGHARYATFGGISLKNTQPLVKNIGFEIAVAHNGDLEKIYLDGVWLTVQECRERLQKQAAFDSTTDTEIILHLLARTQNGSISEKIFQVLENIQGAYSLLFLTEDGHLIAARDPWGFRPLWLGEKNGAYYFSSEDYALKQIGINPVRELEQGEIAVVSPQLTLQYFSLPKKQSSFCSFEFVYFAFPASNFCDRSVSEVRRKLGRRLAQEVLNHNHLPQLDLLTPVLDSGFLATLGFWEHFSEKNIHIPLRLGIFRNHYSGRSFTTAGQENREYCVDLKHIVDQSIVRGKRVGIVDDSVVRSTTMKKLVGNIRTAGAKEVHVFIPSPRIIKTCPYGIDMKTQEELIAANKTLEETRDFITANSLHHLSIDGFRECFGSPENFCMGCFTGAYPTQEG